MEAPLLSVEHLTVSVQGDPTGKELVKEVSFQISTGKISALVGGSGSGKTTTGLAILRLLSPALRMDSGQIRLNGVNLLSLTEEGMRRIRGKQISMVFQEPLNAFNPVLRIGAQIAEMLQVHTDLSASQRRARILELLKIVEINDPLRVASQYPHQLSGGLRQRAMIAQAIAAKPRLLIADEPTSNLDVTIQARIMELFRKLRTELELTMILITHDLGLVRELADEVVVFCGGKVVEKGFSKELFDHPGHPYTRQLLEASLL